VLKRFEQFIVKHSLCTRNNRIILAVSGGLDSMVMLDLFRESGYDIVVAHVNFQLRGEESDGDENFVRNYCHDRAIPFHSTSVETNNYATRRRLSTQMAARELRYEWFEKLVAEGFGDLVATAHHLTDSVETTLLRLVHGVGAEGLKGIPIINGAVIRPLMFTTRREVEEYAAEKSVVWREDLSNQSLDYQRNVIRHLVLPSLRSINPALEETLQRTSIRARGEEELMQKALQEWMLKFRTLTPAGIELRKEGFTGWRQPEAILFQLISSFGFSYANCLDIIEALPGQPGKKFLSSTHQLVVDRDKVIVGPYPSALDPVNIAMGEDSSALGPFQLIIRERAGNEIVSDPSVAVLDKDKVSFPLQWRSWKDGDYFFPLGMSGRKKVSDFLIDLKLSLPEKQSVTVIESQKEIIWLPGLRIDDRYKVTAQTRTSLVLSFHKNGS
jgi:tRNA(Ile)-lysidine synthase